MAETFKNARLQVKDTATDVYECPAATVAIVIGTQVANVTSSGTTASVWWTDASAADAITRLVENVIVPGQASLAPLAGKLVLEAGDKIRVQGAIDDATEITVSVLEIS